MVFRDQWSRWVRSIKGIFEEKSDYQGLDSKKIDSIVDDIVEALLQDDAQARVEVSAGELSRPIKNHLEKEMQLFSDAVDSDLDADRTSQSNLNMRLEQAKDIKDSLEEALDLPDWLKKYLSILNEIIEMIT